MRAVRPVCRAGDLRGRRIAAARAAAIGIGAVGRRGGVRLRACGDRLANDARQWGRAVMGGAATSSHNFPTRTRRPSGIGVQVTMNGGCFSSAGVRHRNRSYEFAGVRHPNRSYAFAGVRHPTCFRQKPNHTAATREASSPRRKTPRKPPKAARAAAAGGPRKIFLSPPTVGKNLKNPTRPTTGKAESTGARRSGGLGARGV